MAATGLHQDAVGQAYRIGRVFKAIENLYLPDNTTQFITDAQLAALTTLQSFSDLVETQMAKMNSDAHASLAGYQRAIEEWAAALGITTGEITALTGWTAGASPIYALVEGGEPKNIEQPVR